MSILADFYNPDIIHDLKYKFSHSGNYYAPPKSTYDEYIEFIKVTYSILYVPLFFTSFKLVFVE